MVKWVKIPIVVFLWYWLFKYRIRKKSCLNLSRICEYGVSLDEAKEITLLDKINDNPDSEPEEEKLTPDGFVSLMSYIISMNAVCSLH